MFVACRLHIPLGGQEVGKFKLVSNRLPKLHPEQHVGVLDRAPILLAPIPALVPAEMDLVEDRAQGQECELLMVEGAKNLLQAPRGRALGQIVRQGLNPELQGVPADLLVAKGRLLDLSPSSSLGVEGGVLL
jgi:hypothetical protein